MNVGDTYGPSEWLEITQDRIDQFAEATGDDQWIHVDPEKAAQGPFGTTIAHGFLTLSLLVKFVVRDAAAERTSSGWGSTTASTRCASRRRCRSAAGSARTSRCSR